MAPALELTFLVTVTIAGETAQGMRALLAHSLMVQTTESITAGKTGRQELDASGLIASTDRKQREMNARAQLTASLLFSQGPQTLGTACVEDGSSVFS